MTLLEFEQKHDLNPGFLMKLFDDRYILSDKKEFKNRPHRSFVEGDTSTVVNVAWFKEYSIDKGFVFELTDRGIENVFILWKNNINIPNKDLEEIRKIYDHYERNKNNNIISYGSNKKRT